VLQDPSISPNRNIRRQRTFLLFPKRPSGRTVGLHSASYGHCPRLCSAVVIPNLSLGLSLASPHLSPDQLDTFMRRMLVSRISRRVLAEHHIALSESVVGRNYVTNKEEGHVGIIFTGLNVEKSVQRCTALLHQLTHDSDDSGSPNNHEIQWPEVNVEGHIGAQFAYIREHLELVFLPSGPETLLILNRYIIFELLKNVRSQPIV
jgi:hypothetical protein